jgi:hypothetical protein
VRDGGKEVTRWVFDGLPRSLRSSFLVDTLMGSSGDLYDAVFDVDITEEPQLFPDDEGDDSDGPALRSLASADNLRAGRSASRTSHSRAPLSPSPHASPRRRMRTLVLDRSSAAEIPSVGKRSPLAKLFLPRLSIQTPTSAMMGDTLGAEIVPPTPTNPAIVRMETILEEFKNLPVAQLKDEMKELQVR